MSDLVGIVTLRDGAPIVSSLAIAEGIGREHKQVIRLIRDNLADFDEFGRVRFENAPFETAGGVQRREVALLNERQATLLMTYMRNSAVVRVFKRRLVRAFFEMARRLREAGAGRGDCANCAECARMVAQGRELTREMAALRCQLAAMRPEPPRFVGRLPSATVLSVPYVAAQVAAAKYPGDKVAQRREAERLQKDLWVDCGQRGAVAWEACPADALPMVTRRVRAWDEDARRVRAYAMQALRRQMALLEGPGGGR